MLQKKVIKERQEWTVTQMQNAGIMLTNEEKEKIEVSDFGLSNLDKIGIQLLVYVNTERVCAKEIVLLPNQV